MKTINSIKLMTIVGALSAMSVAAAERLPATKTFEAQLATIRMPVSENGTIALRECDSCAYESIRVTPGTQYRRNNENMSLDDFRIVIQDLKLVGKRTVNVRRDEASGTVVLVFVTVQ